MTESVLCSKNCSQFTVRVWFVTLQATNCEWGHNGCSHACVTDWSSLANEDTQPL